MTRRKQRGTKQASFEKGNLSHVHREHASSQCQAVLQSEVCSLSFAFHDNNGAKTPDIIVSQTDVNNQTNETKFENNVESSKMYQSHRTSECTPTTFPTVEAPSHLDHRNSPPSAACELAIDCRVKNEEKPSSDNESNNHLSADPNHFMEGVFRPGDLSTSNVESDVQAKPPDNVYGDVCVMNPKSRERGRRKLEARTAKRALFIIAAFVVCWLPMSVITYLEVHVELVIDIKVFFLTFSILSAVINPLIYTFINTAYRNEFKRLLKMAFRR